MKKLKIILPCVLAVLVAVGLILRLELITMGTPEGKLTFTSEGSSYVYDLDSGKLEEVTVDGYDSVFCLTGSNSEIDSFYCLARKDDTYYALHIESGEEVSTIELSREPKTAKFVTNRLIIGFDDEVKYLSSVNDELKPLTDKIGATAILPSGYDSILWSGTSYRICIRKDGKMNVSEAKRTEKKFIPISYDRVAITVYDPDYRKIYFIDAESSEISEAKDMLSGTCPIVTCGKYVISKDILGDSERRSLWLTDTENGKVKAADYDEILLKAENVEWVVGR